MHGVIFFIVCWSGAIMSGLYNVHHTLQRCMEHFEDLDKIMGFSDGLGEDCESILLPDEDSDKCN